VNTEKLVVAIRHSGLLDGYYTHDEDRYPNPVHGKSPSTEDTNDSQSDRSDGPWVNRHRQRKKKPTPKTETPLSSAMRINSPCLLPSCHRGPSFVPCTASGAVTGNDIPFCQIVCRNSCRFGEFRRCACAAVPRKLTAKNLPAAALNSNLLSPPLAGLHRPMVG
jgi:hypothetical protein